MIVGRQTFHRRLAWVGGEGEHGPWYWKRVKGANCPASIYLGFRSDEK